MTEVDPYYYDENDWHIHDVAWSTSGEQAKSKVMTILKFI